MYWIDRIKNKKLEIITGNGKSFFPLWKSSKFEIEYNAGIFNFINTPGAFVDRKNLKGRKHSIILYFQGSDCIDQTAEFLKNAEDSRPWTIRHPLYDDILVQPISLAVDNSVYNVSRITGSILETIELGIVEDKKSVKSVLNEAMVKLDSLSAIDLTSTLISPNPIVVPSSQQMVSLMDNEYTKLAKLRNDIMQLKDYVRKATYAVSNMLADVNSFINEVIALINWPIQVYSSIKEKMEIIKNNFQNLMDIFITEDDDPQLKTIYRAQSCVLMGAACVSAIEADYETRKETLEIIEYLRDLKDTYIIDGNPQIALQIDYLVNVTIGYLFEVSFLAKQERILTLEQDSNVVLLSHRLVGTGDEALNKFIRQNNISRDELLQIKKGREIVWYV